MDKWLDNIIQVNANNIRNTEELHYNMRVLPDSGHPGSHPEDKALLSHFSRDFPFSEDGTRRGHSLIT